MKNLLEKAGVYTGKAIRTMVGISIGISEGVKQGIKEAKEELRKESK